MADRSCIGSENEGTFRTNWPRASLLVRGRWRRGAMGCAEGAKRPEREALSRGPAVTGHVRRRRLESVGKILTAR
ncbi:hypothetical protein GCM10009638_20680 [Luteococcus sanguinis]